MCRSRRWLDLETKKFKGIRGADIHNEEEEKFAKEDENINVLTLGGDYLTVNESICIIRTWIATEFKQGRYQERIQMIEEIENENMK